jgi:hypothetical protein
MTWKSRTDLQLDIDAIPKFVFREVAVNPIAGPPPALPTAVDWSKVPYSSDRAITEECNHKPLAFVSGRYSMIQFKDAFQPLLDQDCLGQVKYNDGFAILDVFPDGDAYLNPDGSRIGITSYNSVDKTSAMIVKFSILKNNKVFTLPHTISGFYKAHVGKVGSKTADYLELVGGIRLVWNEVINKMSNIEITPENFEAFTKDFETDPRILKEMLLQVQGGSKYNLWSMSMAIYDQMETKYAKTDIHRRKRIDTFIKSITGWGMLLSLGDDSNGTTI